MSKVMDMEYREVLKKLKPLPKDHDLESRKINFVVGNTFDVFPKSQRLTEIDVRKICKL